MSPLVTTLWACPYCAMRAQGPSGWALAGAIAAPFVVSVVAVLFIRRALKDEEVRR